MVVIFVVISMSLEGKDKIDLWTGLTCLRNLQAISFSQHPVRAVFAKYATTGIGRNELECKISG